MTISDNVPHETNAVDLFVVVDIETTGLNPNHDRILSLGAVAVEYDGQCATICSDYFYQRIDQRTWIEETNWYATVVDTRSTLSWWLKQPMQAQLEAWRGAYFGTATEAQVASDFHTYLRHMQLSGDMTSRPIFVANPASFDKPFIDQLFHTHKYHNQFDYRTLCLRSMAYGGNKYTGWGNNVRTNEALIPHHAFFDAYAQAHDLVDLLTTRDDNAYEDKLYFFHDPMHDTPMELCAIAGDKAWFPRG